MRLFKTPLVAPLPFSNAIIISFLLVFSFLTRIAYIDSGPALAFDYYCEKDTSVKVYYDLGSGLNEQHSIQKEITNLNEWVPIRIALPTRQVIGLRLDPSPNAGTVRIRNLRILYPANDLLLNI